MSTFDYAHELSTPVNSNQAIQGTLSSKYTTWAQNQVHDAADAIAYQWFQAHGDLDAAVAIRDALQGGQFSVEDLFLSANGKSSLGSNLAGDPHPKLVVAGQVIDLTSFFSGTHVTEWTSGNAKNVQYHAREYYTNFHADDAPANWDHPVTENHQPTATTIHVDVTETQSVYNAAHQITNLAPDVETVQLINGVANDVDGDVLHVVDGSVSLDGGASLPSYITVVGDTIEIDKNSRVLDELLNGGVKEIKLTYQITDGHTDPITNTVTIDITGTADQYHVLGEGSVSTTHYRSDSTTGGGNINGNVLSFANPLPSDAFDFHFGGTVTAQASGLGDGQKAGVADGDPEDWGAKINLTSSHTSETVNVTSTALDDHQVNYNVTFTQADSTDSVKVTLDYQYDYWHMA